MKKPEEIRCPKCLANPGQLCIYTNGENVLDGASAFLHNPERFAHNARVNAARKAK